MVTVPGQLMKLVINKDQHFVFCDDREITLTRIEFDILWLLCSSPGKVYSRDTIFKNIWGKDAFSKERTVDVHLVNLRRKIGSDIIRTIKGVGYKITHKELETIGLVN